MGFLLGPSLVNAFLAHHKQSLEYRPLCYRRYVDDIILLLKSFDHIERFQSYLNFCHVIRYRN